jgi:hypothetical protein
VSLTVQGGEPAAIDLRLQAVDGRAAKAREVLQRLTDAPHKAVVLRRDTLTVRDGTLESLSAGWLADDIDAVCAAVAPTAAR